MSSVRAFILQNKALVFKIFFVVILAASTIFLVKNKNNFNKPEILSRKDSSSIVKLTEEKASSFLDTSVQVTKDLTNDVLGITTKFIQETASKSADTISHTIIQTAADSIIKQIDKLPEKDREEVMQSICK